MDIILLFLAKPLDKHGTTLVHITYPPLRNREEQVETALYFLCFESMKEKEMLHVDAEWAR